MVLLATVSLALNHEAFSAAFRSSPMKRAKRAGGQRNARVVPQTKREAKNRQL
jgi:hypothetical protein